MELIKQSEFVFTSTSVLPCEEIESINSSIDNTGNGTPSAEAIQRIADIQAEHYPEYRNLCMPPFTIDEEHNAFSLELDTFVVNAGDKALQTTGGKGKSHRIVSFIYIISDLPKAIFHCNLPRQSKSFEVTTGDLIIIPPYHNHLFELQTNTKKLLKCISLHCCFIT